MARERPWERVALQDDLPADPAQRVALLMALEGFYDYLDERQRVWLRREAGWPRDRWTDDPILQRYRFLNVYRELDRVNRVITGWLLPQLVHPEAQILNLVAARHFNRAETIKLALPVQGVARLAQNGLNGRKLDVFPQFRVDIREIPHHPYTTAYRTTVFVNLGSLNQRENTLTALQGWAEMTPKLREMVVDGASMRETWAALRELPGIGPFVAYMIACDLTYTGLTAYDLNGGGWCFPHVGSRRALARMLNLSADQVHLEDATALCRAVWLRTNPALERRRFPWWQNTPLSLRHVEDNLCEYHRYLKAGSGGSGVRKFAPHVEPGS